RPGIGGDVMDDEHEYVVVCGEPQQRGPEQRTAGEVERTGRRGGDPARELGLPERGWQERQVEDRQRHRLWRDDALDGLAIQRRERGVQRLVPADDLFQATTEQLRVQGSEQAQGGRDVVGGAARLEQVEEPKSLLGKRQRQVTIAGYPLDRWRRHGPA